jgi:hypothetical protein
LGPLRTAAYFILDDRYPLPLAEMQPPNLPNIAMVITPHPLLKIAAR